jgi:hypothetical protein
MSATGINTLKFARQAFPAWFDRVENRLEGIRTAAMFGKRAVTPQRRTGETWEECFRRTCLTVAPDWIIERATITHEAVLRKHALHSSEPFPDKSPCTKCKLLSSYEKLAVNLYNGDPFAQKNDNLPYMEPEFFRKGAGVWGKGKPSW